MKSAIKYLSSIVSSLGLFTVTLSFSSPVQASIPCESGTINRYQNGSIESCVINNIVGITQGSLAFSCKQGQYIYFDDKASFKSCVISIPMVLRTGNDVKTCPEESRVYVWVSEGGNQAVSCQRL